MRILFLLLAMACCSTHLNSSENKVIF